MSVPLPTPTTRKRTLETDQLADFTTLPLAPREVFVTPSYFLDIVDVRWNNPGDMPENKGLPIVGVNIYRSFDNQVGSFQKINTVPIGALYYRDVHQDVFQADEPANWVSFGTNPMMEYVLKVANRPIVKPGSLGEISRDPADVVVKINGNKVPVFRVNGETGEVTLITSGYWDPVQRKMIPATIPGPSDVTTCSYYWTKSFCYGNTKNRVFYRVTTVLSDGSETPLTETYPHHVDEVEPLDYIWTEAIRRNAWILDQGGERVEALLRKWVGPICECYDYQHENPKSDCPLCYGTGFTGGYEGPYRILIAPQNAERGKKLTPVGLVRTNTYDVWTGPNPVLANWDVIVKQNGERFSIGPILNPSARGMLLQQMFSINMLEFTDIRYKVPILGQDRTTPPVADTGYLEPIGDPKNPVPPPPPPPSPSDITDASPVVTVKPTIDKGVLRKGRTVTWDNITY